MPPDERPSRVFRRSRRYREGAVELGERVRGLRTQRRWTLEQASGRMGLDFRHLQQIEAGSVNVTLATILRVADAFEVPPVSILPGPKRPPAAQADTTAAQADTNLEYGSPARATGTLRNPPAKRATPTRVRRRVGRAVAQLRREREVTQAQLAKRMRVSVQYVQKVEAGKQNLTIDSIVKFANALRVDPARLFAIEG